jgi:hypothetical protein
MVFNNYDFDPASPAGTQRFTAGNIDVWFDDTPDVGVIPSPPAASSVPQGTNLLPDVSGNFSNDTLVMKLVGHVAFAGGYTLASAVDPLTLGGSGVGFLDVVPGSGQLAPFFDNRAVPAPNLTLADFRFAATLQPSNGIAGSYPVFSSDPITTFYVDATVPEPTSFIAWIGLMGVVSFSFIRRRFQAS